MLGKAMQHLPAMRKNAEQRFVEAVLLAPEDPAMRVELARYFLAVGNRSRAVGELHTALQLDPGNEAAQQVMSSLKPASRMEKLFRKLFG
jgi:predicted Zn-dependent protease